MAHTSAVNFKNRAAGRAPGNRPCPARSSTYLTQKKAPLARTKEHREARANRIFFITDIASLRYSALRYPGMLYPLRCAGPPLFTKGKRPRFTPPCGAERKACGLPRSIRCVPQHCRGLHLKMRCQAGVGHPAGCTPAPPRYPVPPASPHPRWPIRSRFHPPRGSLPQARPRETHRRRAKGVFALSPWPVYVSQPRASVTEADTRPPALLISSPVWARRKSPRGQAPRRAVQR